MTAEEDCLSFARFVDAQLRSLEESHVGRQFLGLLERSARRLTTHGAASEAATTFRVGPGPERAPVLLHRGTSQGSAATNRDVSVIALDETRASNGAGSGVSLSLRQGVRVWQMGDVPQPEHPSISLLRVLLQAEYLLAGASSDAHALPVPVRLTRFSVGEAFIAPHELLSHGGERERAIWAFAHPQLIRDESAWMDPLYLGSLRGELAALSVELQQDATLAELRQQVAGGAAAGSLVPSALSDALRSVNSAMRRVRTDDAAQAQIERIVDLGRLARGHFTLTKIAAALYPQQPLQPLVELSVYRWPRRFNAPATLARVYTVRDGVDWGDVSAAELTDPISSPRLQLARYGLTTAFQRGASAPSLEDLDAWSLRAREYRNAPQIDLNLDQKVILTLLTWDAFGRPTATEMGCG